MRGLRKRLHQGFNYSRRTARTATLRYRKLLWFPILTTLLTASIALFFLSAMAIPVVLHPTGYATSENENTALE
jgi:hypothetical protein